MFCREKNCDDQDIHVVKTVSTLAAFAGILGLACLAYRKRDQVDWDGLRHKTRRILTPIKLGAMLSRHEAREIAREKGQNVLDKAANTTDKVHSNIRDTLNTIGDKLQKLSPDDHDHYVQELTHLRHRIDRLIGEQPK
jgi:hypothetical protein